MTDCKAKLEDLDFQNWLKAALAINIAKKGVTNNVLHHIEKFHDEVLNQSLTAQQYQNKDYCSSCSTNSLIQPLQKLSNSTTQCQSNICNRIKDNIYCNHIHRKPSWKNTDARQWCTSQWEVAKCYLPPAGYNIVNSFEESDLNGILSVILNLSRLSNEYVTSVCEQAREVTRQVRHSPTLTLTTECVEDYLETLVKFLECSKDLLSDQTAVEAAKEIGKLKVEHLMLSKNELITIIQDQFRNSVEGMNEHQKLCLEQIKERVIAETDESIKKILQAGRDAISDLQIAHERSLDEMQRKADQLTLNLDHAKTTKLKEDLITFTRKHHTTLALSPLFDKRDASVETVYVEQNLCTLEHPLARTRRSDVKRQIQQIGYIFNIKRCNEIYVTSKAGMGKTAFCKRIAFSWCQAHDPPELESDFDSEADLEAMRKYEFLFMIPLRNTLDLADVDDMIMSQVVQHLSRSEIYTKDFLQEILTNEQCLVILDGLDEWTYPKGKPGKHINDIPHRKAREKCTILTTSRTWKYCTLSLSSNQIDLHVQILGLADENKMIRNAFQILDVDEEDFSKNITEFNIQLDENRIQKLKNIPLILVSLICLWHSKRSLGKTYCNIFFGLVDMLLHRAELKFKDENPSTDDGPISEERCKPDRPYILQRDSFAYCKRYYDMLMSLGRLAFETFFHGERELSLVFDSKKAIEVLGGEDFNFCVNVGFLTRSTAPSRANVPVKMSFAHKTFQEFFAALFMFGSSSTLQKIEDECYNVENILAVSDFYVFLCGIAPEKAKQLSPVFTDIIARSETVSGYRSDMGSWNYFVGYNETIKRLQTLFVDCMTENKGIRSDHQPITFRIEDFIVDEDYQKESYKHVLGILMRNNKANIKSIKLRHLKTDAEFKEIVEILEMSSAKCLEKVDLKCTLDDEKLEIVLQRAEKSLKCFIVKGGRWLGNKWQHSNIQLSNKSLQLIWSMKMLEELYLRSLEMTHKQYMQLLNCVSEKTDMKHIGLGFIICKTHGDNCPGDKLDLSKHSALKFLEVGNLPISDININTTALEVCYVGDFRTRGILRKLFKTLPEAKSLHVFCCGFLTNAEDIGDMLSMLPSLRTLEIVWLLDMNISKHLFPKNRGFEKVKGFSMIRVEMHHTTFKTLVDAVGNTIGTVFVGIYDCSITPKNVFDEEKKRVIDLKTVHVIHDVQDEFIFRTLA